VIVVGLSTSGYFAASIKNISKLVFILLISDILTASLEFAEYDCSDINAIVHKIAKIVITTINSTNVNQPLQTHSFFKEEILECISFSIFKKVIY
jgi:hypothetical protein